MHKKTSSPTLKSLFSARRGGEIDSSSTSSAASSSLQLSPRAETTEERGGKVVAISVLSSNAAHEDFHQDMLLAGDIVLKVTGSNGVSFPSRFSGGKIGLFTELGNFHKSGTNILTIQVQRGEREIARTALIVPSKKSNKYVLQDYQNPAHVFTFEDTTVERCGDIQAKVQADIIEQLPGIQVEAVNVPYPWNEKTGQVQNVEDFRMVYSMLVVPHAYGGINMSQPSNLEETVGQAITWLYTSKDSGVPLNICNIQTEPLLTEASRQGLKDELLSTGTYNFKHGLDTDFGVIRAVRIWFEFKFAEVKVELLAKQGEALLGMGLGRTLEGFCYVASVDAQTAADRAGLKEHLEAAEAQKMKLVVTRVFDENVIPSIISNDNIRCHDIRSISSKLWAHHRAGQPAYLHVLDMGVALCQTESQAPSPLSTSSITENSIYIN